MVIPHTPDFDFSRFELGWRSLFCAQVIRHRKILIIWLLFFKLFSKHKTELCIEFHSFESENTERWCNGFSMEKKVFFSAKAINLNVVKKKKESIHANTFIEF